MNSLIRVVAGVLTCMMMAACVSQTTGPPKSDTDLDEAADHNYQLGARYYRNGSYDLARDRLLLSLEQNSDNAIAWSTLALTYEQLENRRLAEDAYEKALKSDPRNFDVQNTYAVYLCRQGRFEDAEKYFERAAEAVTNDFAEVTLTNAGVCMTQKPDYKKAEDYFRAAIDRKASYGEALLQLSVLKHQTEDYLSARGFLQRYLSTNKVSPGALYLGAQIEKELGDSKAQTEFENRLLREFPQSPEARQTMDAG